MFKCTPAARQLNLPKSWEPMLGHPAATLFLPKEVMPQKQVLVENSWRTNWPTLYNSAAAEPLPRPSIRKVVLKQDASSAAAQAVSSSPGTVAVNAASGVGVARDEAELPWWKKKLNPIYQRALEVLPPKASQKLKQANELARQYVGQSGSNNEELNKVVETAQPVLAPVAVALGVKDEAGPSPDQQKLAAQQEAAQSKVGPNGIRTDYAPADNAYSGTELAYTADVSGKGVTSPGVFNQILPAAPQPQACGTST